MQLCALITSFLVRDKAVVNEASDHRRRRAEERAALLRRVHRQPSVPDLLTVRVQAAAAPALLPLCHPDVPA